ncbi:unnamed protein product [Symbiodinium sp. CCMP2592]|nr:unnamed protein product [Symbiodinium sp. CCMP2592]
MGAILLAWSVQPAEEDGSKYSVQEDESFPCEAAVCGDDKEVIAPLPNGNGSANGVQHGDSSRALMGSYRKGSNGDDDSDEASEAASFKRSQRLSMK